MFDASIILMPNLTGGLMNASRTGRRANEENQNSGVDPADGNLHVEQARSIHESHFYYSDFFSKPRFDATASKVSRLG